ncbi:hypothetical protein BN946_scf184988.g19 [Trametes cinnabarina]|uniref:SAM-dependent MTase RsmB/NOP-type domain-containing protein n=1 Tax=Pycnoporus cinnabarinus TaxID=5643 RepID=A0A060SK79_PYCCI|nr:hypothetical protein BN946_scf184988.g19 [Trametes cinnabarina]
MNFYFEAVNILDKLDAKKGSIKGIIASVPEKDRKRTAALVIETLKYKHVLNEVIDAAHLLKQEKKINSRNLALVLVHDLLLARGIQAGDGPIKQAVLRHRTRLQSEFTRVKIKKGVKSHEELAQTDDARADDPLYLSGKVILQDKASCFPAHVLAPPARDDALVIDATAAPGNKTSHLCGIMQNKGKLFAFERDRKRFSTLKTMMSKAHCNNVEAVNSDFLMVSPDDPKYTGVTHILLDPSCSGSGIVNRLDHLLDNEQENDVDSDRLIKLAAFQLKMIRHAMTSDAESVVRCSPGEDATNGFFVSLFVRKKGDDMGETSIEKTGKRVSREGDDDDAGKPVKRKRKNKKGKATAAS